MDRQSKKEMLLAYKRRTVIGSVYGIKNTVTGKVLLLSSANSQSVKNQFEFAQNTGSCVHMKLQNDWRELGADAFVLDIYEELTKKEEQTPKEFAEDLKLLEEIWREKLGCD